MIIYMPNNRAINFTKEKTSRNAGSHRNTLIIIIDFNISVSIQNKSSGQKNKCTEDLNVKYHTLLR